MLQMLKKAFSAVGVFAVVSAAGLTPFTTIQASAVTPTASVVAPHKLGLTSAQSNAVAKAKSYLRYSAFSRVGLIDQLEFEGFSTKVSTFAVDYIRVSWRNQAYKKAQSYLKYSSFSLTGLIEQLEFEGFTHSQAVYGAKKAY